MISRTIPRSPISYEVLPCSPGSQEATDLAQGCHRMKKSKQREEGPVGPEEDKTCLVICMSGMAVIESNFHSITNLEAITVRKDCTTWTRKIP